MNSLQWMLNEKEDFPEGLDGPRNGAGMKMMGRGALRQRGEVQCRLSFTAGRLCQLA